MAVTAQQLHDLAVRHRVGLGRYSNQIVREVISLLAEVDNDVVLQLQKSDLTAANRAYLEKLLVSIREILAEGWLKVGDKFQEDLDQLAGSEADFSHSLVETGAAQLQIELRSGALTAAQVVAAVKARPFARGGLLADWLANAEEAAARRVVATIQQGFVESRTTSEIVRLIRGTRAARYRDGIIEINRRSAEAMVRTAITHTSSVAAQETYDFFTDVISGIEWVSTLDSRTTLICIGLDGQVFPLDSGPRPPAHINCRSVTIPRLQGMKPFERGTFAEWIKTQPVDVQDEILGSTRAKLWRDGGLKLDGFTDDKQHVLTLAELRAKDADAFRKAGL